MPSEITRLWYLERLRHVIQHWESLIVQSESFGFQLKIRDELSRVWHERLEIARRKLAESETMPEGADYRQAYLDFDAEVHEVKPNNSPSET